MSGWLILVTMCIYFYVAGEQTVKGNVPMAVTYFFYACSNIGLWMAVTK